MTDHLFLCDKCGNYEISTDIFKTVWCDVCAEVIPYVQEYDDLSLLKGGDDHKETWEEQKSKSFDYTKGTFKTYRTDWVIDNFLRKASPHYVGHLYFVEDLTHRFKFRKTDSMGNTQEVVIKIDDYHISRHKDIYPVLQYVLESAKRKLDNV